MNEFHLTVNGRRYYENHVPRIANALEKIAGGLEKLNEEKVLNSNQYLEKIADELETYEPALSRLLRQYL